MADDDTTVDPKDAPPTGNVNANSKQVLANTLQGGPLDSKKWLAMMVGLACVMVIVTAGMVLVATTDPVKAPSYISLANMAIVFIGAMVTSLVTGQSAVEWKTSSSLSDMHNTEVKAAVETNNQNITIKKDIHIDVPYTKDMDEKIKEDTDETAAEVKPFSAPAQGS